LKCHVSRQNHIFHRIVVPLENLGEPVSLEICGVL
jgi:hypothetical protein